MSEDQEAYLTKNDISVINTNDTGQDIYEIEEIVSRLRNRNVAQLLDDLGEQPPCIVRSIKRQFTRMANDIIQEIQDELQIDGAGSNG